ncbi:MAG: aminotransferase class I/II-fold pyridoxal phosphate-dependent enzyme [Candidatus Brocadiae bacterium]|nr:aminotransferase class I/II-fold pyridoxal phosphate-dependent enzyme [Candidatus Brocadiia bacterium]
MVNRFVVSPSKRTNEITYAVRDVLLVANEAKKRGKEMIYLNIGDPIQFDFYVHPFMVEAVYDAMKCAKNGYAPSAGVEEGLESIRKEAAKKGIKNVQDVFVSYGASEAIEICLTALADPGDNVILPSPGYPLYSALNSKLGIESRYYRLNEADNWQPDVEDICNKIDQKTKGIVLINPNNPTGSLYSKEVLVKIIEIANRHNLLIFADEIYDKILFDNLQHTSIAALTEETPIVTFGGLSKCYIAPGWRIGWGILSGPSSSLKDYIGAIHKMTRARLSVTHPMQYAIKTALEGDQRLIPMMNNKLQKRRDITYKRLNSIQGLSCVKPTGAFYAFPKIEIPIPDKEFVEKLVLETGVVVVHGSGFGDAAGKGHFRIVFLPEEEILEKAYNQIERFMQQIMKSL